MSNSMKNYGWAGWDRRVLDKALSDAPSWMTQRINIVGAGPTLDNMMLFRITRKVLGNDTENYAQQIGDCFKVGSLVKMSNGCEKPIEEIEVGEKVITPFGNIKRVVNTIHKKYTGEMITIKAKGFHRSLTMTSTHDAIKLSSFNNWRFKYKDIEVIKAGKLKKGDYILFPYSNIPSYDYPDFDLLTFAPKGVLSACGNLFTCFGKTYNRFIKVDVKLARFLGLYLAEGGCSNCKIQFSYNSNEIEFINETQKLFKDIFGIDSVLSNPKPSVTVVNAYSTILERFIKSLIPGDLYNKNVPTIFYSTSDKLKLVLLGGWMDGDGNINGNGNRTTGVSASNRLISDMFNLCVSCGINPKTLVRKKEKHQRVPSLQLDLYGRDSETIYPQSILKPIRDIKIDRTPYGFARKLRSVETEYVVDEDVFCVEVEDDHALIVNSYAQKNCVSFGVKNAIEYLQCCQIILGNISEFHNIFPPYAYGTSRLIGNMLGGQDGSVGIFAAQAANQYGELNADADGVPKYSGDIAKKWGASQKPWANFKPIGQKHLVQRTAKVASWEDAIAAITNLYTITVASDYGFEMSARNDGFHHRSGSWGHQMMCCGIDNGDSSKNIPANAIILNSWGENAMGPQLQDFRDPSLTLPPGVLRISKEDFVGMIKQDDTWAYSSFDAFDLQQLPSDFFSMV
jgi:hypothetical protein